MAAPPRSLADQAADAATQHPVFEVGADFDGTRWIEDGRVWTNYGETDMVHPGRFGFPIYPPFAETLQASRCRRRTVREWVEIPLSDVVFTQDFVYCQHVRDLAGVPGQLLSHPGHENPITVIRLPDRTYEITNGAHRAVSAAVRRDVTIGALLIAVWE